MCSTIPVILRETEPLYGKVCWFMKQKNTHRDDDDKSNETVLRNSRGVEVTVADDPGRRFRLVLVFILRYILRFCMLFLYGLVRAPENAKRKSVFRLLEIADAIAYR